MSVKTKSSKKTSLRKNRIPPRIAAIFFCIALFIAVLEFAGFIERPAPSDAIEFSEGAHHTEKEYQAKFAQIFPDARLEVIASNKTRCDILTHKYAIEVEFARKWQEAVGQALNYSAQFGRQPGIALIMEQPSDEHYLRALKQLVETKNLNIELWTISSAGKISHITSEN